MEIRLLGPVEIAIGDRVLDVGPAQRRLVLATLAAEAGRSVSTESLVDRVWDEAPDRARRTLQVHISRIRRLLAAPDIAGQPPVGVVRRSGGYLLDVDPDQVDVYRFRRLVGQARDREGAARMALLTRALELWRGPPLSDLPGRWAAGVRQGWQQQYLDTVAAWAQASLRAGDPGVVLPRLGELVGEHPLVESLAVVYMHALCAAGRPADALDHYTTIRHRLADELGADPSPELQRLHRQILAADPALAPSPTAPPALWEVPRQLPASPPFTGRDRELATLDQAHDASTVVIAAIDGMAGIGKTALAVHWAHRVADRFPDGQLYADLRGYDPSGSPTTPADAVRGFLEALGVPSGRIPPSLDGRTALYRSLLAGRRVLVVLDNARDADQVRPLLPGTPTARVLVTSRNQLTGLIAAAAAHPLTLDVLSPTEARELLSRRLGAERIAAEPEAVERIIVGCARLPLALGIAAARAQQTGFPLDAIAAELDDAQGLDTLDAGDADHQVRAVFSWSYTALSAHAARLFRLLGLHCGPDLSTAAVASLAGCPLAETRSLLAELTRANLITEHIPGRYVLHDLLRAYAGDLTRSHDPNHTRHAAVVRLLDHYTHAARTASHALSTQERGNIVAAARQAVEVGAYRQAQALVTAAHPLFHRSGDHPDRLALWSSAALAATALDDRAGRTRALRWIARSRYEAGDVVRTVAPAQRAAELAAHRGDRRALGEALLVQGQALRDLNRFDEAARVLARALDLAVEIVDTNQEISLRAALGTTYSRAWEPQRALLVLQPALPLLRDVDDHQRIWTLHSLSLAYRLLGRREHALAFNTEMLHACQRVQDEHGLGHAFQDRGWIAFDEHRYHDAAAHMQAMLTAFQRIGNASEVGFALDALGQIALAEGRTEDALPPLTAAIDQFQRLDNPLRAGRSRLYRAVALTSLGHIPEARSDWMAGDRLIGTTTMREAEPLRRRLRTALRHGR